MVSKDKHRNSPVPEINRSRKKKLNTYAGWLLLVLVPAAEVLTLESGTDELVGFAAMGKLELLA